jgi:hypothetical protein
MSHPKPAAGHVCVIVPLQGAGSSCFLKSSYLLGIIIFYENVVELYTW